MLLTDAYMVTNGRLLLYIYLVPKGAHLILSTRTLDRTGAPYCVAHRPHRQVLFRLNYGHTWMLTRSVYGNMHMHEYALVVDKGMLCCLHLDTNVQKWRTMVLLVVIETPVYKKTSASLECITTCETTISIHKSLVWTIVRWVWCFQVLV